MSKTFSNNQFIMAGVNELPTYLWGGTAAVDCLEDNFSLYFQEKAKKGYWTYSGLSDVTCFPDCDKIWEFEYIHDFCYGYFHRHVFFLLHKKGDPDNITSMGILSEEVVVSDIDYFEGGLPTEVTDPKMIEYLNIQRTCYILMKVATGEELYV
jgi:hypothetical protein